MRRAILSAARARFAEVGFRAATLSEIATNAGTSIGNLYKYFSSKDDLFSAAIPQELVERCRELLRHRVEALGTERDAGALPDDHPHRQAGSDMLAFVLQHRMELLFLLRHEAGTPFDGFVDQLARDMASLASRYAERAYPGLSLSRADRRVVVRIYAAFISAFADVLAEERSPQSLREAIAKHTTYHLAGLRALFTSAAVPTATALAKRDR